RDSLAWLREWRPDVALDGHQPAVRTDADWYARLDEFAREYEADHRGAMGLGHDEGHFGLDGWGGWIEPYRSVVDAPGVVTVTATVRNPFPTEQLLDVALVGPRGWRGSTAQVPAGPRAEVRCTLTLEAPVACVRQAIAVELSVGERRFGQVAEAL